MKYYERSVINLLFSCEAWPEDGSTQLCFVLLWTIVPTGQHMDIHSAPLIFWAVLWLCLQPSVYAWTDWGSGSPHCIPFVTHVEPVKLWLPSIGFTNPTTDQQNHSWHILAGNTKQKPSKRLSGEMNRRMSAISEYTRRQMYTNLLSDS